MKTGQHISLVFLSVLAAACGNNQSSESDNAILVVTEEVGTETVDISKKYVGQVEEFNSTTLSFTGEGTIRQLLVDEGQYVKQGQLVAVLDEEQMQNALAASEAALHQAQDAYDRLKMVHDAGSLAEQQWVEVESKLQQAQSTYDMAKKSLKECRLEAPTSGVIGSVSLRSGETALPSMPVCTVLDISKVKVRVGVPEKEIGKIGASTSASIDIAAIDSKGLRGGSIERGVTADAMTHTYDIKIVLDNPGQKILPGMVANVKIDIDGVETNEDGDVITLPVMAVSQNVDGSLFVWTVNDGKATRTPVTVGSLVGNRVVITSGLSKGQSVIVEGYQKVSDGDKVKS